MDGSVARSYPGAHDAGDGAAILRDLGRIHGRLRDYAASRPEPSAEDAPLAGLCISEADVEAFLQRLPGDDDGRTGLAGGDGADFALASGRTDGCAPRLHRLADLFELSGFDIDVVLLCLAVEVEAGYERLYAYLQDDLTRRLPGVGLVLDVLCGSLQEQLAARRRFAPSAALIRQRIVRLLDDPSDRPGRCCGSR